MIKYLKHIIHKTQYIGNNIIHFFTHDPFRTIQTRRFWIHNIIFGLLLTTVFTLSIQENILAVLFGIVTVSYIPFLAVEAYGKSIYARRYVIIGISMTVFWGLAGFINTHYLINALWSAGYTAIGRWVRDYCIIIRERKTRKIFNQTSTIGIFLIAVVFAMLTMRRFQSINFSCANINFLSSQFITQFKNIDQNRADTVTKAVASGGRNSYMQLVDDRLQTEAGSQTLGTVIKEQLRNSIVVVMDQKQLYDKSICDYVTTALNDNYQKSSFFYSGILLLTFIGLPAARIALLIVGSIFSCIMRICQYTGIYRPHKILIEHKTLK